MVPQVGDFVDMHIVRFNADVEFHFKEVIWSAVWLTFASEYITIGYIPPPFFTPSTVTLLISLIHDGFIAITNLLTCLSKREQQSIVEPRGFKHVFLVTRKQNSLFDADDDIQSSAIGDALQSRTLHDPPGNKAWTVGSGEVKKVDR